MNFTCDRCKTVKASVDLPIGWTPPLVEGIGPLCRECPNCAPGLIGRRVGIFDVLDDDRGKYAVRLLTVRCVKCSTQTTRQYKSVVTFKGKGCIHCHRSLAKAAIIRLFEYGTRMTRRQVQDALPRHLRRSEPHIRRILNDLIEEGIVTQHMEKSCWVYTSKGVSNGRA